MKVSSSHVLSACVCSHTLSNRCAKGLCQNWRRCWALNLKKKKIIWFWRNQMRNVSFWDLKTQVLFSLMTFKGKLLRFKTLRSHADFFLLSSSQMILCYCLLKKCYSVSSAVTSTDTTKAGRSPKRLDYPDERVSAVFWLGLSFDGRYRPRVWKSQTPQTKATPLRRD